MSKQNQVTDRVAVSAGRALARLAGAEVDGGAPERVLVAPWGEVKSTSGSFVVDAEAGCRVVEAFAEHGTDLPIDFEHQTLGGAYASPQGVAPAAGWITALAVVEGEGVVATVNWTDEGRKLVASRAYRYLSPVALIRPDDRRLIALHSVALTNKPAIVGMTPLVNRDELSQSESLVQSEFGEPEAVLAALSARLSLASDADTATVLAAAEARLAALEDAALRRDAEARVEEAQRAGKLTPAQREWALTLALSDAALFDAWLETAPVIVAPGRMVQAHRGSGPDTDARTARARVEYRSNRALQGLTSEAAYVAESLRERLN